MADLSILSSFSSLSLLCWLGRVLVCGLRLTFIHPAARQKTRECYFLTRKFFPCCCLAAGSQPSTPAASAAVRASFFPTFCGFFAHDSFFPSFHVGSTPWTRTSTIARLCLTSAAPDPSTDGRLGPWEFSRLLPRPVGMWLGQTYMLKVCLPGHEGSISCPYVMYCSVLAHGFRH